MNRQKLLSRMINLTLVALLLTACGAPAGAPISASPTITPMPTLTPAPTSTPTSAPTPTLTPAPTSTPTSAPTPTLEPQAQVILAWHEAWNRQDIDAFMALVADDAVLDRGPYGVITGTEKIRATVMLEMKEKIKAKVSRFEVEGDQVTYYYEVFIGGSKVDQGVGVAIVENGKIKSDLPAK